MRKISTLPFRHSCLFLRVGRERKNLLRIGGRQSCHSSPFGLLLNYLWLLIHFKPMKRKMKLGEAENGEPPFLFTFYLRGWPQGYSNSTGLLCCLSHLTGIRYDRVIKGKVASSGGERYRELPSLSALFVTER